MTEKLKKVRDKIQYTQKTKSVVRMMKAFSSAKIHEFRSSSIALEEYQKAINRNLTALSIAGMLPQAGRQEPISQRETYILIGSDQGMVGRFNDHLFDYIQKQHPPKKHTRLIVIGSIIASKFYHTDRRFRIPLSVDRIPTLIGDLLHEIRQDDRVIVFYNRPAEKGIYEAVRRQLLPFSQNALKPYISKGWQTNKIPQLIGGGTEAYTDTVIREFYYIALYQMCADSLVSEHATRLASMEEAEKNIEELLEDTRRKYNQIRQDQIDRELFDLISGYLAMTF